MTRQGEGRSVVCIGGGPAGLTAGYLLSKQGYNVTVLERDPLYLGGISKTACYKGFRFDIGGHRFFSKSQEVEELWTELLGADFLERPRRSRIFYRNKLFHYPLRATDALLKLGVVEAAACVFSYLRARISPIQNPKNFEEWITNNFGDRLYRIFFKTYTEKVWGMKCTEISADWAAQRIKGLSLKTALWNAVFANGKNRGRSDMIKTLIDHFRYPRRGPGMVWDAAADRIRENDGKVLLGFDVVGAAVEDRRWTVTARTVDGSEYRFEADHLISSAALRELIPSLAPEPPQRMLSAASSLRYRDFLIVGLIVKDRGAFDDNWIYVHDPNVKVGRIQNFKSWSPEMVPYPDLNCYGLEYFCFEGDMLWTAPDSQLIKQASEELVQLGLASSDDILDGCVIRQQKAYPVYDDAYQEHVDDIRDGIRRNYPNLHLVGRNGMHKYNNQDHAMMTAMLTVRNIVAGTQLYDVWSVNQDAEYHETGQAGEKRIVVADSRLVPRRVASSE
jgi:protoporphyrinogen oxidase